jgi:hypothetical protein
VIDVRSEDKNIIFCDIVAIVGGIIFIYGLKTMYQIPFVIGGSLFALGIAMRLNVWDLQQKIFKDD